MRISDWSSDVCSSDPGGTRPVVPGNRPGLFVTLIGNPDHLRDLALSGVPAVGDEQAQRRVERILRTGFLQIGRPRAAGDRQFLEVERTAQAQVDAARYAAFEPLGRTGFVDVDARECLGGQVLKREA